MCDKLSEKDLARSNLICNYTFNEETLQEDSDIFSDRLKEIDAEKKKYYVIVFINQLKMFLF